MVVKYGEFISAKLKPTWEDTSKAGDDKTGWKRGGRSWEDGESKFMRSYDRAADAKAYGPSRPNGPWRTASHLRDPGTITNDGDKGYKGIDH
ncbi:MAG: hypothetical protein WAK55_14640 [Xanthobacteraceae bacterium]